VGSFYRRYGKYIAEGAPLEAFVEITIKDDERKDPPISKDALLMLNILKEEEYEHLVDLTRTICGIIKEELAGRGIELYDIKLEFGRIGRKKQIALIDEVSGGNMRRPTKEINTLDPLALEKLILNK